MNIRGLLWTFVDRRNLRGFNKGGICTERKQASAKERMKMLEVLWYCCVGRRQEAVLEEEEREQERGR
jgi:hypothetical protein